VYAYVGPNGVPKIVPTLAKNRQLKKKISIGMVLATRAFYYAHTRE